jgi:predicted nuclease with TOPRIM domain
VICADIEYVSAFKNLQETLRRREGEIYALQSRVIELESQLEACRRAEGRDGADARGQQYRR